MATWIEKFKKIESNSSDSLTDKVLKARGIPEDKHIDFLAPDDRFEYDYDLMRNVTKGANLIKKHVDEDSHIVISGDPDADGVTSLVIMYRRLGLIHDTDKITYIYPQRDMGHGINGQLVYRNGYSDDENELVRVNRIKVENADLLIIVDSSSNDVDGLKEVYEMNEDIDIIIVDHHEFDNTDTEREVCKLATVINPQHSKDEYPNKHLSGAGVVYKLCKALDDMFEQDNYSNDYLDLVAVGLIGDMMDVAELENRYLISQGLQNVKNIGLTRILKGAKVNMYKYNSKDIGFSVAPLINASARMGQIELAIEILLVDDDNEAKPLRLKMDKLNKKRQEIQKEIFDKYDEEMDLSKKIIIISDDESNKGFNGLVAQSIAQKYQRPCFVVRDYKGMSMGSGRSYGGFNTQEFLSQLDWVETSGHGEAHGLNFPSDKLDELEQFIEENMTDSLAKEIRVYYDLELNNMENIWYDIEDIGSLNYITGKGFPEVKVRVNNIMIGERNVIGKTKETVKFSTSGDLVLIKFKVNEEWKKDIDIFDEVSVVGTPIINEFYNFGTKENVRTPQIIIQDIIKEK